MTFNKKAEIKNLMTTFALPCILVAVALLSMCIFQYQTTESTEKRTHNILKDSAVEQLATVDAIFEGQFNILYSFANSLIAQKKPYDMEDIQLRMAAVAETTDFLYLGVTDTSGMVRVSDGREFDAHDRFYFQEAMAGRKALEKIETGRLDSAERMMMAVPIMIDGQPEGAVIAGFADYDITKLLVSAAFQNNAYSYICDSDGQILIKAQNYGMIFSDTTNIFQSLKRAKMEGDGTVEKIAEDLKAGKEGTMIYFYGTQKRYASYIPMGVNDWFIVNFIDGAIIDGQLEKETKTGVGSIVVITICALLLFCYIVVRERRRIGELKKMQENQLKIYTTDPLTGLLNFKGFENRAREILDSGTEEQVYVLIECDINSFGMYNTLYGAEEGDRLLTVLADMGREFFKPNEAFARITADHFVGIACASCIQEVMDRMKHENEKLKERIQNGSVLLSFGLYEVQDKSISISEMRDRANIAKRTVKGNYEVNIAVYDQQLHNYQVENMTLVSSMEESLLRGEFVPYYQPKYNINTEEIVGAEALVRWMHHAGEIRPPDRFITLFEKNGLISKLDRYMFEEVCKKLATMMQRGEKVVPISVNFSRAHLFDLNFADKLAEMAKGYGVPTNLLEIELTESAFLKNQDVLLRVLPELHEHGFLVSIDDFGSGFSSLNILKDAPFDIIKIDRGFLTATMEVEKGRKVIESILCLAKQLHMETVVEGVETKEQLEFLRERGCSVVQGFYFSEAVSPEEFDDMVKESTNN